MSPKKKNPFFSSIKTDGQPLVFAIISAWLLTLSGFQIISPITFTKVPDYTDSISIALFLIIIVFLSIALYCLNKFLLKKALFIIMPLSFMLYGAISTALSANNVGARAFSAFIFCILSLIILVLCVNYAKNQKIPLPTKDISFTASLVIVIVAFVLLSAYWIFMLWARTVSYCAPGFDMGIFTQMYDNMVDPKFGFQPITTCERGSELSHFAVHFSPILYLLMPFCLFIEPIWVLVFAQILLVLSGVFPIFLICRHVKLSNLKTTVMSLLYLLYPAMSSGSFYDFHENAFLAPLILWTLYFSHKKKWYSTVLMFFFALLVLMVKEDAAIYVAFISLYLIFGQRKYIRGASMFIMTVAYFFFAIFMISQFQQDMIFGAEGNMLSSRYANIIGEDGGFLSLVKVLILNPALYAVESLTADKLTYALNMLLPLAFLPLITRKPSRWLLLGPFYVLNLVTDYQYQYDIGFQYSFGSGALLIYLAVLNLADLSSDALFPTTEEEINDVDSSIDDAIALSLSESDAAKEIKASVSALIIKKLKKEKIRFISYLTAIGIIFAIFSSVFIQAGRAPAHFTYARRLASEGHTIETVSDVLSGIDRDKSIFATSMYITHLYDADELYSALQVFDGNGNIIYYTDIVVLDLREYISDSKKARLWTSKYLLDGYEIVEEHEGMIRVLQRTESSPPTGYSQEYLEYQEYLKEAQNEE